MDDDDERHQRMAGLARYVEVERLHSRRVAVPHVSVRRLHGAHASTLRAATTAHAVKRRLHDTKRTGSSVVLRNRCGTPESNPNESPARTTYESNP